MPKTFSATDTILSKCGIKTGINPHSIRHMFAQNNSAKSPVMGTRNNTAARLGTVERCSYLPVFPVESTEFSIDFSSAAVRYQIQTS